MTFLVASSPSPGATLPQTAEFRGRERHRNLRIRLKLKGTFTVPGKAGGFMIGAAQSGNVKLPPQHPGRARGAPQWVSRGAVFYKSRRNRPDQQAF
jgi:hypothetical protein